MSYIIVATDFSETSENAVDYAAGLSVLLNTNLVIIHSFIFPVLIDELPLPASLIDQTQKDAERSMDRLTTAVQASFPDIYVQGTVAYGTLVDSIEKYATEYKNPRFTVLGNSNSAENTAWFFSTLNDAVTGLGHPVLAIPPKAGCKPVQKICFATDTEHEGNLFALQKLSEITLQLGAELHVFSASKDGYNRDNISETDTVTKDTLAATDPQYHFVYEVDVDEAIHRFCIENNMDWLVVVPGKYSMLEGLFHKSHTKALAKTMSIPLLILH